MYDDTKLSVKRVSLFDLLCGDEQRFVIPHYQRKYSWSKDNCETLFADVLGVAKALIEDGQVTHFFSNVTLSRLDDKDGFHVVDGQQRLTTLSLFLRAFANVWPIHSEQLVKLLQVGPLLKLSFEDAVDQRTYRHLMKGRFCEPESVSHVMVENFRFFEERITTETKIFGNVSFEHLLGKLLLVKVVLPKAMTPQRVFERMNGVRKPLEQLDLIKNFLLMEAGIADEKTVYDLWEGRLVPQDWLHWVCWQISLMHAQGYVAEHEIYKNFRRFYEKYGKTFGSVLEFLGRLESWKEGFGEVNKAFTLLNGNNQLIPERRDRLGPLIMKLVILFPSPEGRDHRNELVARIVERQRCYIAGSRLSVWKMHKASLDEKLGIECLKASGHDYDQKLLSESIIKIFKIDRIGANVGIERWFQNRENSERSKNADIIGIWPKMEIDWSSAEEVVAHFHETLRKRKEAQGIQSDPDSFAIVD